MSTRPNCCNNLLVVTGPAEKRRRLARLWTDGDPVFNRILPQPDPFTERDIAGLRARRRRFYPGFESEVEGVFDDAWWWRNFNWGTTRDVDGRDNPADVREEGDRTIIDFMTDNCPPFPVVKAMSRLYPGLTFCLKWFEVGSCLAGEIRVVDGVWEGRCHEDGSSEYERLAAEFGYENEEDDE
jgi:hypothetical protein